MWAAAVRSRPPGGYRWRTNGSPLRHLGTPGTRGYSGPGSNFRGCTLHGYKVLKLLRIGSRSFWGAGRPRGPRRPFKKVGMRKTNEISTPGHRPDPSGTSMKPEPEVTNKEYVGRRCALASPGRYRWGTKGLAPGPGHPRDPNAHGTWVQSSWLPTPGGSIEVPGRGPGVDI
jgi:hypothetical protein